MTSKVFTPRFSVIITAILLGALMRLVPHWPNFTPVAAIALFGGAYISRKYLAFIIPIAAMLISDLFLGFHPYLLPVYGCFAVSVLLGIIIRKNTGFFTVVGASLLSSVIFYCDQLRHVGSETRIYPDSRDCFNVTPFAIPFSQRVLVDPVYNGILFGVFTGRKIYSGTAKPIIYL